MQLAHDLQMKLLPSRDVVAPDARVAARVVPAESVGGDFYHLFRLGDGRTGVMIGDVSGHGYRAALIMALAMSASAIHAQAHRRSRRDARRRAATRCARSSTTTEMFISAFYARHRPARGRAPLREHRAPARVRRRRRRRPSSGSARADPPLGMVDDAPATVRAPVGARVATCSLLFTDGVSDARNRAGARLGEEPVLEAVARRARATSPTAILDAVFDRARRARRRRAARDDLTLVVAARR